VKQTIKLIFLLICFFSEIGNANANQTNSFQFKFNRSVTISNCGGGSSFGLGRLAWGTIPWAPSGLISGQSYQFEFCVNRFEIIDDGSYDSGDTKSFGAGFSAKLIRQGTTTKFVISGTVPNADWNFSNVAIVKTNGTQFWGKSSADQSWANISGVGGSNNITIQDIQKGISDAPFTLTNPTSSSSGAFSYTSSDTSVATISGNTVTIQGIGSTTITVTQSSDGNYAAATATATLTVGLNSSSISLADIDKFVDDPPFNITNPTSSSSGAFSYTSSDTSVATISGNTVTIQGLGTSTITVTQAAAGSYASATTTATLTVTKNLNDPVVAFEAIKTEIESITKNSAISNSVEQVRNAEFIMREKMVFHGEMMRAEPSTATASFVDYNFNLDGNSFGMVGDGKYHQTDISGDQFRRRIMIDAKRVHSKNESVTQVVSALSLFDIGISEKTSSQYRFGFKQSDGKGNHPIKSSSKARAYRVGVSLSHSFNEKVFGGVFGDLIYTQTKSSFQSAYTNVIGKIRTYSASGGAQLTGQYEVYAEFWIKPTLALSYSREYLIRKRFVSNTSLGSTVVEASLPMPTVFRITAEPEFLYESFANQDGTKDFVSVNPSYACENMKSGTKVDACNTGIYFQIGKKSDEKGITGKFYFSYENLNSGPKHEYGLQFKSDF